MEENKEGEIKEMEKFTQVQENSEEIEEKINEMEKPEKEKNRKKKRNIIIAVIVGIIIILTLFISTIFAFININNEKIIKGVSIENIDMSGLSKEEAKNKLETIYN